MFCVRFSAGGLVGLLVTAALTPAVAQPTGFDNYQIVRIQIGSESELARLAELQALGDDFQVWSEVVKPGPIEVRVAPAARAALDFSGLPYEVIIPDLQPHLDKLFDGQGRGFFDALRTYLEHVQFMTSLVAAHPDLAQMVNLGPSVQNRAMWALRITGPGYAKPAVFYHGAEHGNESAGASVVAYVANHLLTNYGTDPAVTALVNECEWYLLPIMNPDGYVSHNRYNAHGVDLNRNWAGPGSGQDPWGGPYPFSEPETQHLRDFLLTHPTVRVHVDLHGYVPWIMWPWGHIPDHCPHHATFAALGAQFRDLIVASGGGTYEIGTIYEVAYPVSGCSTNYSYGVNGLWAFGIEVIDDQMPNICQEFRDSLLYLGDWLRDTDCNGNGAADSTDIANGTSTDLNQNARPDECEGLGDLNCDQQLNFDDVNPFVLALSDPAAYESEYPQCPFERRDINGDGLVNFGDINPFVTLLSGS